MRSDEGQLSLRHKVFLHVKPFLIIELRKWFYIATSLDIQAVVKPYFIFQNVVSLFYKRFAYTSIILFIRINFWGDWNLYCLFLRACKTSGVDY